MQLFEPIVEESQQHPNFRAIMSTGNGFNLDVINEWAKGFVDRDGKFAKEFQTTFNSCFWELYLFAVLKKYGMQIDFSKNRPDFCIPDLGLNIEATIASHSRGAQPEHARLEAELPHDLNRFNFQSIIRIANSLTSKHQIYLDSYSKMDHVKDRAFVVAIANFDQPYSFIACQRPIEAVLHGYYVDEERYLATGGKEGSLSGKALWEVLKDNGSPIELGMFATPEYREISAVIFNGCATLGKVRAMSSDPSAGIIFSALRLNTKSDKPHIIKSTKQQYEENLFDGLRIYHNPYASHPISPALFRHASVFQSYYLNDDWVYEQRDGQLLSRSVVTILVQ
jgi:hypothetical protein